jgi:glycosyltransferase 2 family protein
MASSAPAPTDASAPWSWSAPVTRRIFGIVPDEAVRRHPSELVRVGIAAVIVVITAVLAEHLTRIEKAGYDLVVSIPSGLRDGLWVIYLLGTVGVLAGLAIAVLVARRLRFTLVLIAAGLLAFGAGIALQALVDSEAVRDAAGLDDYATPTYPVVSLAIATAVVLVASAYLTRTARHLVVTLLALASLSAFLLTLGLSADIIGALALGWGIAALVRFAVGSPEGTPSVEEVMGALGELGVQVTGLRLLDEQVWGEARFAAREIEDAGERPLYVVVIGRDASDARLLSKLWRFVWYKDSGPAMFLTRLGELEHRAYVLLRAAQAGVPVAEVVAAGTAGEDEDAVLVTRQQVGQPLPSIAVDEITDELLDRVWTTVERLHASRLVHGSLSANNILVRADGGVVLTELSRGSTVPTPVQVGLDRVQLLATTAALVGEERGLAAALRVLGKDGLAELLTFLEPAALSAPVRRDLDEEKKLLAALRDRGAALTGVEAPTLVPLRRISVSSVLMAAGAILGVYLLIGQFSDVPDLGEIVRGSEKGWIVVTALLSQLPQFAGAFVMLGSVATQLPYGPTLAVQFANNFTGFVAGSVGTTAMIIRYFQRQGLAVAIAVSSGVLKTISSMVVEVILVAIALIFTWGDFDLSSVGGSGSGGGDGSTLILIMIIVAGVGIAAAVTIPKLRLRVRNVLAPQLAAARTNLKQIAGMPMKMVQLFGGNLASELLFAMVLLAALHAYGQSLPLLQVVLINSFASLIGGLAPIPGGMGVVEAGMIAGFTAAGIPQGEATAATFTARTFTTYLPPIWGWFALNWLRRRSLV